MKKEKSEFWAETLEHITATWQKKKGRKYPPFTGKELNMLKQIMGWLTAAETMALWSTYLVNSPFWGPKTGFSIVGLFSEKLTLIDDPNFKTLVRKFETELGLKEVKQVALELGLK